MTVLQGARAAEEAGPSSSGQGFFSTTTDRSRQSQGGITAGISQYAPQKDVQRLAKRQALQRIAAGASVGTGRWHEGAGGSGIYGTPMIGGGGSGSSHVVGGFEFDTDRARRERTEKQQQVQKVHQEEQTERAASVAELAANMKENEDADLADNPEVAETIMADMSAIWEVPTPDEIPEDVVATDEAGGAATDASAEKSTGTVTGEWAVGQDHRNKQEGNTQATASATPSSPVATSSAATGEKPKSQGTITGEWAVGADHKMKQSRRPPPGGRGFES